MQNRTAPEIEYFSERIVRWIDSKEILKNPIQTQHTQKNVKTKNYFWKDLPLKEIEGRVERAGNSVERNVELRKWIFYHKSFKDTFSILLS